MIARLSGVSVPLCPACICIASELWMSLQIVLTSLRPRFSQGPWWNIWVKATCPHLAHETHLGFVYHPAVLEDMFLRPTWASASSYSTRGRITSRHPLRWMDKRGNGASLRAPSSLPPLTQPQLGILGCLLYWVLSFGTQTSEPWKPFLSSGRFSSACTIHSKLVHHLLG